jgi:putative acetyltransferase
MAHSFSPAFVSGHRPGSAARGPWRPIAALIAARDTPRLAIRSISVGMRSQARGNAARSCTPSWARLTHSEPLAALLGDPTYYRRFGFELGTVYQIIPPRPEWQPHFQVRVLTEYQPRLRGKFTYPKPFDRT